MSKRALVVGINAFAPADPRSDVPNLKGCVNDAEIMARHLTSDFGFPPSEVRVLLNPESNPPPGSPPGATGEAIRRELAWLFSGYDNDGSDVRVFHLSTHGTQVRAEAKDGGYERDALDEAFVVHDHQWAQPFRDNELRELLAHVPSNVTVVVQADCCHSGDLMAQVVGGPPSIALTRRPEEILEVATTRSLTNPEVAVELNDTKSAAFRIVEPERPDGRVARPQILISACEDFQESKEFLTASGYHGALTWAVSKTIEDRREKRRGLEKLTYEKLIREVGQHLGFSRQTPRLECPENLLDQPIFSASGEANESTLTNQPKPGGESKMSDEEKNSVDQILLFLMTYVSAPKKFKLKQLMKRCQLHPELQKAMTTKLKGKGYNRMEAISLAMSEAVKPIGHEGGGRPIGHEGG